MARLSVVPLIAVLVLAGCADSNGGTDTDTSRTDTKTSDTSKESGTTAETGTDTGTPVITTSCTLDPALTEAVDQIRVTDDGAIWMSSDSELYRYTANDKGAACVLEGSRVWENKSLEAVSDFELDAAGNAYLLVQLNRIVKLSAKDRSILVDCGNGPGGHAVVVNDDGSQVWTIGVGDDALVWTTIDGTTCTINEGKKAVALKNKIGTSARYDGGTLVVDYHDAEGTRPPGVFLDPTTGAELGTFGDNKFAEARMASVADIAPAPKGYYVAGSPDGDLWFVDDAGTVLSHRVAERMLGTPKGETISIRSVGYSDTGPSYVSAAFLSRRGVWRAAL